MSPASQPARSVVRIHFPGLRTLTLLLAGVLVLVLVNVGSLRRYFAARQQRNKIYDVVEAKKREVWDLERQKRSLELGMFENEKSVREGYRLVRPGERMIRLVPEESPTSGSKPAAKSGVKSSVKNSVKSR